jgi:hypothetical protein
LEPAVTSPRYPGYEIADITEAGRLRQFYMVNLEAPELRIIVKEWKPGRFVALVFRDGRLVRRFDRPRDACEFVAF